MLVILGTLILLYNQNNDYAICIIIQVDNML